MTEYPPTLQKAPRKEAVAGDYVGRLDDVTFVSPDRVLFFDLNMTLKRGSHIGLKGESGSGKSTLLRIMAGDELPDAGTVEISPNVRMAYVPQSESEELHDETIEDLYLKARGLFDIRAQLREMEDHMGDPPEGMDYTKLLDDYAELADKFNTMGGNRAEADIRAILAGLGLSQEKAKNITTATRLSEMSSGQRTRILLGRALYSQPDLLLLDDPTRHLDRESVEWLANYIRTANIASVSATGNTDFIDRACNHVIEITDFGRVMSFAGNHRDFMIKRDELLAAERKAAESLKTKRDKLEATFLKFKAAQVFKRSKDMAAVGNAMKSRIARMDDTLEDMPGTHAVDRIARVRPRVFETAQRSGNDVLTLSRVVGTYGDHVGLDLGSSEVLIARGERFAVTGENGSGKSTLLRIIAQAALPELVGETRGQDHEGAIRIGAAVDTAYFSPDYLGIGKTGSLLDEVKSAMDIPNDQAAAGYLVYFGFPNTAAYNRSVEHLSEGEKRQLALAKLMAKKANFLILDEPTDYLKPEVVQRLLEALKGSPATVLIVSHNHTFLQALEVSREMKLPGGRITLKK